MNIVLMDKSADKENIYVENIFNKATENILNKVSPCRIGLTLILSLIFQGHQIKL